MYVSFSYQWIAPLFLTKIAKYHKKHLTQSGNQNLGDYAKKIGNKRKNLSPIGNQYLERGGCIDKVNNNEEPPITLNALKPAGLRQSSRKYIIFGKILKYMLHFKFYLSSKKWNVRYKRHLNSVFGLDEFGLSECVPVTATLNDNEEVEYGCY